MTRYRLHSWLDPRIEIRTSPLEGKGLFACAPIQEGEVVVEWGGALFTQRDLDAGKARKHSIAAIDENLYLADPAEEESDPADFMNHSCDPNVWMQDEVTLVARRAIAPGEELTADYTLWEGDETWISSSRCNCGSQACRGSVTGQDWRRQDPQERYKDHFSPFINKRIRRVAS